MLGKLRLRVCVNQGKGDRRLQTTCHSMIDKLWRLRQPCPSLILGGKQKHPSSFPSSKFFGFLQPDLGLRVDNIEVVILLRVEGAHVCNLHFLSEQTRLKTLSRVSERHPHKTKGHSTSQATEETEIPLQEVHCPCLYPKIPLRPRSQQARPTTSMLPFLLQRG